MWFAGRDWPRPGAQPKASERFDERDDGVSGVFGQAGEGVASGLGFAAVPEDGFGDAAGAAVVEEAFVSVDGGVEAEAPEWRGSPFGAAGVEAGAMVVEVGAEVVEQEVRVGPDDLAAEFFERRVGSGDVARHVACGAPQTPKPDLSGGEVAS